MSISRIKHLSIFLKDPDKKNFLRIIKEVIIYGWIKKDIPIDYFRKYLYRKDIHNYKDYLSLKEYYKIGKSTKLLVPEINEIIDNKLSFALFNQANNIPAPKLISYNSKAFFNYNNKVHILKTPKDLWEFFENVLNKENRSSLFLKPINSSGGKGCVLLKKNTLEKQLQEHKEALLNNTYIHQEVIKQHSSLNSMNPYSINTLRIDTYLDKDNTPHVLSALMRFGIGNSITDNASSGGFYASVNIENSALQGVGRQDVIKGGNVYTLHPNTQTKIDGFNIPFLKEALDLAKQCMSHLPNRLTGWDIAISENGPVVVEGNSFPSLHITDVAYGGYCKHPLIKEILKEIN